MDQLFKDLFIFEMANNHQGSVEHGLKIIRAMGKIARKFSIKGAVKFQYRDLDTLIHPDFKSRGDIKHIPRFLSTRMSKNDFQSLTNAVQDEGMITICTPFDEPSVDTILDHGIQVIKVASCSADDWPLLEAISKTGRPVICSTGGKSIYSIDNVVSFFTHRKASLALLHCIGLYPTPNQNLNLNFIDKLRRRYPYLAIGYSGHEKPDHTSIVKLAVAKGASILERHVGVAKDSVKLNEYSMNPEQTAAWVESALEAKEMCGKDADKHITQEEVESLQSLTRGAYAATEIKQGETLQRSKVFFAMPYTEGQTSSGEFQEGISSSRNYGRNEPLFERRAITVISQIRGVIHDFKGMFYEASIHIGEDFQIGLSHHYGLEHFRQTGALIVTLINREYCKKLVALLPGQRHPNHKHVVKEETFQLLWGDLEVTLNGQVILVSPGDKLLVKRDQWHSFTSKNGAIFEEISTTHTRNDSYYNDPRISSKDPMERKTVLEDW